MKQSFIIIAACFASFGPEFLRLCDILNCFFLFFIMSYDETEEAAHRHQEKAHFNLKIGEKHHRLGQPTAGNL